MVRSASNPIGTTMEALNAIRNGVTSDRSQYYKDLSIPFFGYNRRGGTTSEGVRENFWLQGMQSGVKGSYDCIKAFSETDFTEDLKAIDVPTLVMHGDDDQIVPFPDAGALTANIVKGAQLKIYPGFPHGMPITHADVLNQDLLEFIRG